MFKVNNKGNVAIFLDDVLMSLFLTWSKYLYTAKTIYLRLWTLTLCFPSQKKFESQK